MLYIRKVRPGRSIHLAGSSCTTTRYVFAEAAWGPLEAILEALGGQSMQDRASELPRIHLPKLFEKAYARASRLTIRRVIAT
jgi:hypothetical protein